MVGDGPVYDMTPEKMRRNVWLIVAGIAVPAAFLAWLWFS